MLEGIRSRLDVARASRQAGAATLSFILFLIAMAIVVLGFIGYYSRVSLISEAQQQGGNLDYLFMQIHQVDRDEADLRRMRNELAELEKNTNGTLITIRATAFVSPEYKAYLEAASAVALILYGALPILADDYLPDINKLDYAKPELDQARVFADPRFKPDTGAEQRTRLYSTLSAPVQAFRQAIVAFNEKFGNQITQIENIGKVTGSQIDTAVREILVRNPQWASRRDVEYHNLGVLKLDAAKQQEFARQRAVIKSYENALPWVAWLLHAPTIVATLLVTLATGWLGGIIGHMGAAIRSPRPAAEMTEAADGPYVGLIRRSILGVTAALGIFLFAGSGLLVLSSQSAKYSGLGIELSPYFVAFLAFISGFLADDAFMRLTKAGRLFLQSGRVSERAAVGKNGRGQPKTPPKKQG